MFPEITVIVSVCETLLVANWLIQNHLDHLKLACPSQKQQEPANLIQIRSAAFLAIERHKRLLGYKPLTRLH